MPGSSGRQQREEEVSHPSRRRCCSSSGGTSRAIKKLFQDRSPSPGRSSCRWEESYRSSSSSSEDDRAESPPPTSGRAPGGTPGDSRPALGATARLVLALQAGSCGLRLQRSSITQALVFICLPLLRARRTMTVLVPLMLWTSTGMTLSGPSWPSSGTSTA